MKNIPLIFWTFDVYNFDNSIFIIFIQLQNISYISTKLEELIFVKSKDVNEWHSLITSLIVVKDEVIKFVNLSILNLHNNKITFLYL